MPLVVCFHFGDKTTRLCGFACGDDLAELGRLPATLGRWGPQRGMEASAFQFALLSGLDVFLFWLGFF